MMILVALKNAIHTALHISKVVGVRVNLKINLTGLVDPARRNLPQCFETIDRGNLDPNLLQDIRARCFPQGACK